MVTRGGWQAFLNTHVAAVGGMTAWLLVDLIRGLKVSAAAPLEPEAEGAPCR
jgi:ammonia channel protein AmtB